MRNRPMTRVATAVATTAASALLLSGCAWKSSPMVESTPPKALTAETFPAALAAAVKGVRMVHMVIAQSATTTAVDFDGSSETFRARLVTTTPATSKAASKTAYMVFVGNDLYIRAKPTDKWLKAALNPHAKAENQFDPAAMLEKFSRSTKSFVDAGTSTIDGVSVHEYDVTLNASELTGSSTSLGASSEIAESFYLTPDNRPRRVVLSLPGGVGDTQIDFTNWGQNPAITVPSADQIVAPKK